MRRREPTRALGLVVGLGLGLLCALGALGGCQNEEPAPEAAPTTQSAWAASPSASNSGATPAASAAPSGTGSAPGGPESRDPLAGAPGGVPGLPGGLGLPISPAPAPAGPAIFDDPRAAAAAFAQKLGRDSQVRQLALYPGYAILEAPDPAGPDRMLRLDFRNGVLGAPSTRALQPDEKKDLAKCLFPWAAVDVSLVPRLVKDAPQRLGAPDGVTHVLLDSCPFFAKPTWRVYAADGYATYDLGGSFLKKVP